MFVVFIYRIDDDLVLRLPEESDAEALLALFQRDREYLTYWIGSESHISALQTC